MDGPARVDDGLFISDDDMAGFFGPAEDVERHAVPGDVEIEIDLHPPFMGMARHGVPDAAVFELGETHHELAGTADFRVDILVDGADIGFFRIAHSDFFRLFDVDIAVGVGCVGRGAAEVEMGVVVVIVAFENEVPDSGAEVETVQLLEGEPFSVGDDRARCPHVDNPHLPALQKELRPYLPAALKRQGDSRAGAAGDDAVDVAVGHPDLPGNEQAGDEEVIPEPIGIVVHEIVRVRSVPDVEFHRKSLLCRFQRPP
ncbi:hypothetical protein SDC9_44176 [bioreactor metagenome]|uniref:Uncharacterized protein n=1 Tax=bioreactor metagenome TaxID=1076179 RepID=A0A644W2M6_9ZZZZ